MAPAAKGLFEDTVSVSHMVYLIWKFSRGGRRATFLLVNKNTHIKECWILIYNDSPRASLEQYAKIGRKSKHGIKESGIKPSGHNSD